LEEQFYLFSKQQLKRKALTVLKVSHILSIVYLVFLVYFFSLSGPGNWFITPNVIGEKEKKLI